MTLEDVRGWTPRRNTMQSTSAAVVRWALLIVGGFIFFSLIAQFLLLWTGRVDDVGVFRPIFDLVTLIVGMVVGYVGRGSEDEVRREQEMIREVVEAEKDEG